MRKIRSNRRPSLYALVASYPLLFTDLELLDFTGGSLGQGSEFDRLRAFEVGQFLAAEINDVSLGHGAARFYCDKGLWRFAPFFAGYGDHRDFQHVGMLANRLFHLLGGNIFSAADDDVLFSIANFNVGGRMHHGKVA